MCAGTDAYDLDPTHQCTHQMKLCVTCEQTDKVYIRVQSNGMPNHCYSANYYPLQYYPDYKIIDWTVEWNPNVYHDINYGSGRVDTQTEVDDLMCSHEVTAHTESVAQVVINQGSDIKRHIGVSFNNQLLFNSLTNFSQDSIDSDWIDVETDFDEYFDNCLGYIDVDNYLAYRSLSPCFKDPPKSKVPGINTYSYAQFRILYKSQWTSTDNYGGMYGIAKDGHIIYGPYNEWGEIWDCDDLDFCNGFFRDDNTSYGYATTTFFPYIVGCWGPAGSQLGEF